MPRTSRPRSSSLSLLLSLPAWLLLAIAALSGCTATKLSAEPPEMLEVKATFADIEGAADGKQAVAVQFFEDGELVELTSGPTIRCSGVELARTGLGYVGRVAVLPSGSTYAIEYALREDKAEMKVTVPPRPEITAPAPGAQLVRTASQDVAFTPLVSIGIINVMATATGPGGTSQSMWQQDNGLIKISTQAMGVGPGSISVVREHQGQATGSDFAAASFTYSIEKKLPVVWQ